MAALQWAASIQLAASIDLTSARLGVFYCFVYTVFELVEAALVADGSFSPHGPSVTAAGASSLWGFIRINSAVRWECR